MPLARAKFTPVTRIATVWQHCQQTQARPLAAHYRLGRAFQAVTETLSYGDKEDLLLEVLGAVRRKQPDCSRSHLQNMLYRSARFARCCDADPHLLQRLERAGFRWWAVCELLSLLVRRLEAPKRDKQAITKVLNQGLTAAAKGMCTPGELAAELKHWRRGHPGYFRGRWNTASLRAAHAKALRALDEAEEAWSVLLRHVHRGNTSGSKSFLKAIAEARMQLNGTPGLPPASS